MTRDAVAERRSTLSSAGVESLDLVVVRVGDEERAVHPRHAERMLQPHGLGANAVHVAELEQPLAEDRADLAAREIDLADRARLAVRDVEPAVDSNEPARLVHRRLAQRTVDQRLGAVARMRLDHTTSERHGPELVRARHRHVERAAAEREIPRRAERGAIGDATHALTHELLARARHRADDPRWKIDGADRVVLRVRDVERIAVEREALRLV